MVVQAGESVDRPTADQDAADVRAWWQQHGMEGLFDVHVHFMEPRIQRAVWDVFARAERIPDVAKPWPIRYQFHDDERITWLRQAGVRRFPALAYAHKPGVATLLNDWAQDFAARVPESLWSATFYPESAAATYVAELLSAGVEIFKLHVQVGGFHLDDPLLDPVWGLIAEAGTPALIHCGSGPIRHPFAGPAPLERLLARHPRLCVIVAHLGMPEHAEFFDLAARYPRVHLDTAGNFTDFWADFGHVSADLIPRLRDLGDRILFGSDFPTLSYPFVHQLEALERLDLGDDWLRPVCWDNAVALFGEAHERTRLVPTSRSAP